MKNLKNSRTSGISLVALIVTIIVLIILTAAVIVTFMEGGIIDRAKESVFKSDIRTYQEILTVKRAEEQIKLATGKGEEELKLIDKTISGEGIKDIIPEFKVEEYGAIVQIVDGVLVLGEGYESATDLQKEWLEDLGISAGEENNEGISLVSVAKVGNYVDYNIVGETDTIVEEDRGWIYKYTNGIVSYEIGYQDIMWRVLKNDGNTVTLVSAEPVELINLSGENGFIKGPDRLDEICFKVYGGRNLKIEDVNEVLGVEPVPTYINSEVIEVTKKFGTTLGDVIAEEEYDVSSWISKPENYEELELVYFYNQSSCTEVSYEVQDMIFGKGNYWLSSTAAGVFFAMGRADFDVFYVMDTAVSYDVLYYSDGNESENYHGLRPVVTLSSNIKVAEETGDGTSAEKPWILK